MDTSFFILISIGIVSPFIDIGNTEEYRLPHPCPNRVALDKAALKIHASGGFSVPAANSTILTLVFGYCLGPCQCMNNSLTDNDRAELCKQAAGDNIFVPALLPRIRDDYFADTPCGFRKTADGKGT